MVPTLWIVLGPLGQSVTAAGGPDRDRGGQPFALTWWSFTFPVGTCVTGTIALATRSDSEALPRTAATTSQATRSSA